MKYVQYRDLISGIYSLSRRGGKFGKAASTVNEILGKIASGDPQPLAGVKVTNNGETRLNHCVKYDLTGFARLVTVQHKNYCFLLFVGTHDEVDDWLERNRGTEYKVGKDGRAMETMATISESERNAWHGVSQVQGELIEHLKSEAWDALVDGCRMAEIRVLSGLRAGEYDDLHEICDEIENKKQAEAIRSVFVALMSDKSELAMNTIRDYLGEAAEVDEIETLVDSDKFILIRQDDPDYIKQVERLVNSEDYRQWMLFMHPEQLKIAVENFDGPAKLLGVSGSGKTCTVVRRAIELSARYPGEKILVLTLNLPLASMVRDLVDTAAPEELRGQIRVEPLFRICQEILQREEPENERLYDEKTWKSQEHVDEIWREFYRCELLNHSAECLHPVHDSLISRGIEAEKYIRQEFDWIRSAFGYGRRNEYITVDRKGRKYPLPKPYRERLLEGLDSWEAKMKFVGVTDYLGIATAASRFIDKIYPEYRCVIVDECQDFGTTELVIARRLCKSGPDDMMLCGDAAQQVSSKFQSTQDSGVSIHSSRIRRLEKNYRNSKDILETAYNILISNISDGMEDNEEFEILDPEFADFSGHTPVVLEADSIAEEVAYSLEYIKEQASGRPGYRALIAVCGYTMYEVEQYAKKIDLPYLSPELNVIDKPVVISDLEQCKGFEFDCVCIVNCNKGVVPDERSPKEEQFRDLARFYVAMTRAKTSLVVSWSGEISPFLHGLDEYLISAEWSEYVEEIPDVMPVIETLAQIRELENPQKPLALMSGKEFLYHEHAIGMPLQVIEQVRKYITGQGRTQGQRRERVQWSDIGTAFQDIKLTPSARKRFGPETSSFLLQRFSVILENKHEQ